MDHLEIKPIQEELWRTILDEKISLKELELLEIILPQVEIFRSAVGVRTEKHALFVRWIDNNNCWGIGECSCRPDPYFSGEFIEGAIIVLQKHLFPYLPSHGKIKDILTSISKIRGWNFATSAILDALFDLLKRHRNKDLFDWWPSEMLTKIPVGISLGLFDSAEQAVKRVKKAVEEGYRRVKLKISPHMNRDILVAIRKNYPNFCIGFDANGSFNNESFDFIRSIVEFQPVMLEQPFPPGRIDLCSQLKQQLPQLNICLDESLCDYGHVVVAHRLNALDEVNLKPGRVGGLLESMRILHYCNANKIPVWIGGMFETAVGRIKNLKVASLIKEAKAHDLSPSYRYFSRDVIKGKIEMDQNGYIDISDQTPVELDEDCFQRFLKNRILLKKR